MDLIHETVSNPPKDVFVYYVVLMAASIMIYPICRIFMRSILWRR